MLCPDKQRKESAVATIVQHKKLNLIAGFEEVADALREMGDYPPKDRLITADSDDIGDWPRPGKKYSLKFIYEWLVHSSPVPSSCECLYGNSGFNRYLVSGDGRIALLANSVDFFNGLSSREQVLEKARSLGFEIK